MTDVRAKVVEFDLHKHPDPEVKFLSIAKIRGKGWQCVVKTTDMKDARYGIYIPIDAEVPTTHPMFAFLDKKGDGKPFRIKTIRLRQQLSQGLLLPAPEGVKPGDDLTEQLGIARWEPTIPKHLAGDMVREPGNFQKYTSIENWKNFPDIFLEGDMVRITEKIHGTNCRFGFVDDGKIDGMTYFVGTHKTARAKDGTNLYSEVSRNLQVEEKLQPLLKEFKPKQHFIVFGEIYGWNVQDLVYDCGKNQQQFRVFDVLIDHVYQPWSVIEKVASTLGVKTVPVLYRGRYNLGETLRLRDGKTTLREGHVREGVVVTAEPETFHPEIGRKIIKFISDEYLLRKGEKDIST